MGIKVKPKPKTAYQKWYAKNSKSHNAGRRYRYATDAAYRAEQQESAQNRRALEKKKRPPPPKGFTTPTVAEMVGRRAQTIRVWEQRGLIPNAMTEHGYRLYQKKHVALLIKLATYMDTHKAKRDKAYDYDLAKLVKTIKEKW